MIVTVKERRSEREDEGDGVQSSTDGRSAEESRSFRFVEMNFHERASSFDCFVSERFLFHVKIRLTYLSIHG